MRERLENEIERLAILAEGHDAIGHLAKVRRGLGKGSGIPLDDVRIGFQCKQRWEDMVGDDRVRACRGCDRPVFNLSEMTRAEAEAVLATRGLTPCVRFYRRADGTVMTSDCPSGVPKRRLAVIASSVATTLAATSAFAEPATDTGAITGTLTASKTGDVLEGATVVVTSPALQGEQVAITDDKGNFSVGSLPAGEYHVTFYYADLTTERSGVIVEKGGTAQVAQVLDLAGDGLIHIDDIRINQGLPPMTRTFEGVLGEVGVITGELISIQKRPAVEWSLWGRLGAGLLSQSSDVAARRITPPSTDSHSTSEGALGVDATFGIAHGDNLRLGAWGEVRTTTDPVGGAELVLEGLSPHPYSSRIGGAGSLVLRAGGNTRVITAALGFGYVGSYPNDDPWVSWARHIVGARVMLSVNRAAEDPRDWSATLGLEIEPIGALHAAYNLVTR